jgi:Na+/H+-dicarboxylate symporter
LKIYTQILLGMILGAVIGLTLGPKSTLLEHNLYVFDDASAASLSLKEDGSGKLPSLSSDLSLKLKVHETKFEERKDRKVISHKVPARVRTRLSYSKKMSLNDRDGSLKKLLGDPAVGDSVEVWLEIKSMELKEGGFVSLPTPISSTGYTIISVLKPFGDIFMRLIMMVIVPLVFASLVVGVASLGDVRKLGRMGGRTLLLYLCTTAMAVTIGLICAHVIKPGSYIGEREQATLQANYQSAAGDKLTKAAKAPSAIDNLVTIVPVNPAKSMVEGKMLQIIFFAMIFGIALTMMGREHAEPLVIFFDKLQMAMVMIIHMVMKLAPIGVLALIADVVGSSGVSVLVSLLVYALTVMVGLLIHGAFVYGGLVRFLTRLPVGGFLRAVRPAQLLAFSTSSSAATLPVSMEVAEENLGVSKSVHSFVLPLGSTVNMDGTALYQGVAAIFIAQVFNIDLSLAEQLGIVLTATMASIGAAGVPGAGMVTLAMVLTAAGIPAVGVALILGMDRILDMFRTAVNVTGDLAVCAVMATAEGEKLEILTDAQDEQSSGRGFENRLDVDQESIDPNTD